MLLQALINEDMLTPEKVQEVIAQLAMLVVAYQRRAENVALVAGIALAYAPAELSKAIWTITRPLG